MAAVLVQSKTGSGYGGSTNIVLDSTPTTGNVLIFKHGQGSKTLCSQPTGGGVTTWASVTSNNRRACRQSYGVVGGSPSATVNFNNNFLLGSWTLEEWSGLDTASLVQGSSTNDGQGATASVTHTPTASSDVMLAANAAIQNGATSNVGGGFSDILGSGSIGPSAHRTVTGASGSYTPSWSTTNAYTVWDAVVVAYKVAASASHSQSVAGGITPSGALATQVTAAILAGGITPTGTLNHDGAGGSPSPQTVAGSITPTGEVSDIGVGYGLGPFVGGITPTGAVTTEQTVQSGTFGGEIVPYGGVTNFDFQSTTAGGITPTGTLHVPTEIEHDLAGGITPTGDVTPVEYEGLTLLMNNRSGAD